MDSPFPFGWPYPTAFYLTLFVLTLVVHVLFMNYVLVGTAWLAWEAIVNRVSIDKPSPNRLELHPISSESILADWIPTMLSGAITAGVAPLLFIQILYQREFYTANLLLFNRWMSILPVLILGFYGLYVLRSQWLARRNRLVKTLTACLPFLCVAFVAYSWTENHLLSLNRPQEWRAFYARSQQFYFEPIILLRLAIWSLGSIPTVCVWLGWQLRYHQQQGLTVDKRSIFWLPRIATFGLIASIIVAIGYYIASSNVIDILLGPMARWWFLLAIFGLLAQTIGWIQFLRKQDFTNCIPIVPLLWSSFGLVATILGASVCRESVRLTTLGPTRLDELFSQHAAAIKVEGFWVFLLFLIINLGLIAWCFRLVKKNYIEKSK